MSRSLALFSLTLLLIEFLDELVFGAQGAAIPVIRADLGLTYEQIGWLLSVPAVVSNIVEPALGILADVWRRKVLIVGGGLLFAVALLLIATGYTFPAILLGFVIFYPASGAFVSLSQATLMDLHPARREQMMVRWTLFGSLGVLSGSLILSALLALGWGWRPLYVAFFVFTLMLVAPLLPQSRFNHPSGGVERSGLRSGIGAMLDALRTRRIVRWLVLLNLADLMGDILLAFVALYFVDVVSVSEAEGALAVTVLTTAWLVGNALIIPLLERMRGLTYLRVSAIGVLAIYALMLFMPDVITKYVLLAGVGLASSGWYAILKGQLYATMPGQSGISMAVSSLAGVVGGLIPGVLGLIAGEFGLIWVMVVLALGPVSLMFGLPRASSS